MDLGVSGVFFAVAAEPLEGGQVATPRLPLRCGKQNAGGGVKTNDESTLCDAASVRSILPCNCFMSLENVSTDCLNGTPRTLAAAACNPRSPAAMPVISNSELILRKMQEAEDVKEAEARQWEASAAERAHKTKMAEQWASMLKVQSGQQCPSSAPVPPHGAPGGSARLATASGARASRLQSRPFPRL